MRKIPLKTWYGVPVLTLEYAAKHLGTSKQAARSKIMTHLRNGLDYFIITDDALKLFKFENYEVRSMANHIFVIIQKEFFAKFRN